MNQAMEYSEIDNGEKFNWDINNYTPEEFWNVYFTKYIKTTKTEYDRAKDELYVYFVDGSMVQVTSNGRDYRYYTNSKNYKNAVPGKDSFMFCFNTYNKNAADKKLNKNDYKYHDKLGIEPYAFKWNGDRKQLFSSSAPYSCGCSENCTNRCYCTKLIQINGWKIPDDYPLKF